MKKLTMILIVFASLLGFLGRDSFADGEGTSAAATQKIDQVLQKQDQILSELAEIKQELYIIKIRASNKS